MEVFKTQPQKARVVQDLCLNLHTCECVIWMHGVQVEQQAGEQILGTGKIIKIWGWLCLPQTLPVFKRSFSDSLFLGGAGERMVWKHAQIYLE